MRQPLIAGNWKMNGTRASVKSLLDGLMSGIGGVKNAEVAVCAPYVFIPEVAQQLAGSAIVWGAQDVAKEESGAFTGEVSAGMLKEFGCRYTLVGHSERRSLYGDSDDVVAHKFAAAQKVGLVPVLCVGELLAEREQGRTNAVVEQQLAAVVKHAGIGAIARSVIAYEPVWAIGTGKTASPAQAQEVHAYIRGWLAAHDPETALAVRVLYGGSMNAANAAELLSQTDIDGGLIGGASLKADDFLKICRAAG
ncbi:MAG: triose-phosphate isomerase [Gammaproteobacteria bacterium]|nr:triose-phosphate isomerase [Gammaproteobacteria bacterium]